jgi:hypothetical protein
MQVTYTHNSSPAEVKRRLDQEATRLLEKNKSRVKNVHYEWNDQTLNFAATSMGATINGDLVVTEKEIIVDARVPMFLRAFEGRAKSRILDTFREMFG